MIKKSSGASIILNICLFCISAFLFILLLNKIRFEGFSADPAAITIPTTPIPKNIFIISPVESKYPYKPTYLDATVVSLSVKTDSKQIAAKIHEMYPEYAKTYIKLPSNIQKQQFLKYLYLYEMGGYACDENVKCIRNLAELTDLTKSPLLITMNKALTKDECTANPKYSTICKSAERVPLLLDTKIMGASPKHPFIKMLIDEIHKNIDAIINAYKPSMTQPQKMEYVDLTTGALYVSAQYNAHKQKQANDLIPLDFISKYVSIDGTFNPGVEFQDVLKTGLVISKELCAKPKPEEKAVNSVMSKGKQVGQTALKKGKEIGNKIKGGFKKMGKK